MESSVPNRIITHHYRVRDSSFIITKIDATIGSFTGPNVAIPQSNLAIPRLFVLCMVGTVFLCVYCVWGIGPQRISNKEYVAMLLVALGFTYQVIGAWPLWNKAYPCLWQQEISQFGNFLVLSLFSVSFCCFDSLGCFIVPSQQVMALKKPKYSTGLKNLE